MAMEVSSETGPLGVDVRCGSRPTRTDELRLELRLAGRSPVSGTTRSAPVLAVSSCGCCGPRSIARAGSAAATTRPAASAAPRSPAGSTTMSDLIKEAHRLRGVSGYVTINPVRLDLLARADNRLARARHTTRDADILCLRWLYLDIDPLRPAEISSTEAELAAAIQRRDAILGDHPEIAASSAWGSFGQWCLDPGPAPRLSQRPALMPPCWPEPSRPSTRSTATTPSGSIRPRPTPRA